MRLRVLLPLLLLTGCPPAEAPPGDESMGSYAFHAELTSLPCGLPDTGLLADGGSLPLDFTGSFSRDRDGGAAFLTLNGVARDAGFDGQVVTSTHSAARTFALPDGGDCKPCEMRLVETLTVALVSQTQSTSLHGTCPDRPLDGGVPGPDDAGLVKLPGSTPTGFDAVLACGELHERIVGTAPDGGVLACDPLCNSCSLDYRLTGART